MKKLLVSSVVWVMMAIAPTHSKAQDPITLVIKEGIKKVIIAVDLKIQRLQNKTIWLQNAQKTLENTMSQLKLKEITGWVEKQKDLYQDYFTELQRVKSAIAYYYRIKDVIDRQRQIVAEYKRAWALFRQDKHFTADELSYMGRVYSGILEESVMNLDQLFMVINSFQTQMSDAGRLEIINAAVDRIDSNYNDLKAFNQQAIAISLQRAKSGNDVEMVKKLYGFQ